MLNPKICKQCSLSQYVENDSFYTGQTFDKHWNAYRRIYCWEKVLCKNGNCCYKSIRDQNFNNRAAECIKCADRYEVSDHIPKWCPYQLEHKMTMKQLTHNEVIDHVVETLIIDD